MPLLRMDAMNVEMRELLRCIVEVVASWAEPAV